MLPELDVPPKGLPHGAIPLGDGYILHKHTKYPILPDANVIWSISAFLPPEQEMPCIRKWARLLLPNGQTACSIWREALKAPGQLWVSHNVKVHDPDLFNIYLINVYPSLVFARQKCTMQ